MEDKSAEYTDNNKMSQKSRCLQTLAAVLYFNAYLILLYVSMFLTPILVLYSNNFGRIIFLLYLVYVYYDNAQHISYFNGNGWLAFRNNFMTSHLRDYYPVELVKTAELEPNRNYLLASFPHGVGCTAIGNNMANNIGNWLIMYPGVRPKSATLDVFFIIPIFRDILRFFGIVSCSKESLKYYLSKSNDPDHMDNTDGFTSNAVAVLVGGVREGLDSYPGRYILTLKNRKGFVKIAITTGSSIVPTFSFGEVDVFDPVDTLMESFVKKYLKKDHSVLRFSSRLLKYGFCVLPKRKRVVQVVGAPIEVSKMSDPSSNYVDEVHQKVIDALNEIFEKYKHKYLENPEEVELVIT